MMMELPTGHYEIAHVVHFPGGRSAHGLVEWIQEKYPTYEGPDLYMSERALQLAYEKQKVLQMRLLDLARNCSEPLQVNRESCTHWDGVQPVYSIEHHEAPNACDSLELGIASVLFHAIATVEGIAMLTLKAYEVAPHAWPSLQLSPSISDSQIETINDGMQAARIDKVTRKAVRASLKEQAGKATLRSVRLQLARDYSEQHRTNVHTPDDLKKALWEIVMWRNMRTHRYYYRVHIDSPPASVVYSSGGSELMSPRGEIRFTHHDLAHAMNTLQQFITWWYRKMQAFIDKEWEHPKRIYAQPPWSERK